MSKSTKNINKTIFWRASLLFGCLLIFAIAVFGKAIHLQVVEGEQLKQQFEEKKPEFEQKNCSCTVSLGLS